MRFTRTGKVLALVLCLVLLCSASRAAEEGAQERWSSLPERVKKVLNHVEEQGEGLQTLRADVHYTRSIPLLEEKEECTGSLLFRAPDSLVMKLGEPRNEDVYSDGSNWWVVSHDDEQVEIYRAVENPRRAREAVFLKFGYGRSVRSLLREYDVELVRQEQVQAPAAEDSGGSEKVTEYVLRFTPRSNREVPSRYSWIEVAVREGRWMPARLKLAEDDGRIVHVFKISNRRFDVSIEEGAFTYTPPGGYTILRPGQGSRGEQK